MEFLRQYEILLKKAKSDLNAGKILFEGFNNGNVELDLETVMFHLQQCAEKLLKSLIAYNKIHVTKTHDIEALITLAQSKGIELNNNINKLVPLTEYAVEGRYTVIHDDLHDTDQYIKILEELLLDVSNTINKKS